MSSSFLRFAIMGADGESRWNFGRPGCPVRLRGVPTGLQGADFALDYRELAGVDGEEYLGRRNKRNTIAFTAVFGDDETTGPEFRKLHGRWRRSLGDSDHTARFFVVSSESGYRWKDVRLQSAVQAKDWALPGELGEHVEDIVVASDSPWWTHPDRQMMWAGNDAYSAAFRNPGDRPAWMRYTLIGPMGGCIVGLGSDRVRFGAIPEGGFILVDTDPAFPTAVNELGEDLYEKAYANKANASQLDGSPMIFREALPAGGPNAAPVPLGINPLVPGPGSAVIAEITPQSERAW